MSEFFMRLSFNKNLLVLFGFLSLIFNLNCARKNTSRVKNNLSDAANKRLYDGEFAPGYPFVRSKSLEFIKIRQSLRKDKKDLEESIQKIKNDISLSKEEKEERLNDLCSDLKNVNSILSGSFGDLFLRGIAGDKNFEMVEDLRVGNDIIKGIIYGGGLRGAVAFGKTIGGKVDKYSEFFFGGILRGLENCVVKLWQFVFHHNCRPFTAEEIKSWQVVVNKDLRNIETMLKNYDRLDSRGRAEILKETQEEDKNKDVTLWQDFVEDYTLTCQELIEEIQKRINYYEKQQDGYGIKNCAARLISKLNKIKNWLIKCKTLKDFLNVPEVKSILPAMRDSLDSYFSNLAFLLNPKDPKNKQLGMPSSSLPRNNYNGMDDGAYPLQMGL
ncbi:MAG: hypothetical protein WC436_05390 [Candidatus Babeliales bacterium]